jgi:hypothetical protein
VNKSSECRQPARGRSDARASALPTKPNWTHPEFASIHVIRGHSSLDQPYLIQFIMRSMIDRVLERGVFETGESESNATRAVMSARTIMTGSMAWSWSVSGLVRPMAVGVPPGLLPRNGHKGFIKVDPAQDASAFRGKAVCVAVLLQPLPAQLTPPPARKTCRPRRRRRSGPAQRGRRNSRRRPSRRI